MVTAIIAALFGLSGVVIGGWLTSRREREKQRRDYITRQLSELYGPLLSLRRQITTRHEFVHGAVDSAIHKMWDDLTPEMRKVGVVDSTIAELRVSELDKFTEYGQTTLKDLFMPDYRRMLTLMRDNMWLAEKSTQAHFDALVEYVDTWELFINGVIKAGVLPKLKHGESKLQPFYADVEKVHDYLRDELAGRQSALQWPWRRWNFP